MHRFVENIISFSIKNHFFIFFLTFLVAVAGIYSYLHTPIEAYPDVTSTRARVITQWEGRSAEEMERFVTIPVEKVMNTIPRLREIRSVSLFGLSVVTMIFDDQVTDFMAQQQVASRLLNVSLPEGADVEIEPPSGATGEILRYVIRSDTREIKDLAAIQEWTIERHLLSVPGIADVVSFGGEEKIYEIRVDPKRLTQYQLTALDVFDAVANSNVNVGGDIIEKSGQAYVVRGIGLHQKIEDIENIIISQTGGTPILVRHIAEVAISAKPRLGQVGLDHEDDLLQGIVIMRRGENPSEVIERLKLKIDELNTRILPSDIQLQVFYDRSDLVSTTVRTVTTNLIEGMVLVSAIVLLFMVGWKTTLMVVVIIPLSLLFAFIMLRIQGLPANLISMGAIDFGIIIDGAVVMVEGLYVTLDKMARKHGMEHFNKRSKLGVIRKSAIEMGKSVFFAKLIIIVALLPIFSFQQVEGKMFSPLAFTLGYALVGALLFSLTLVPAMARILLNKNVHEKQTRFIKWVRRFTYTVFNQVYIRKKIALVMLAALSVICLYSTRFLGTEFLPHLNEGAIYARATLPNSVSLNESVKITREFREQLMEFEEIEYVLSQTGRPNDGTDPTGFFNIEFHIELKPERQWTRRISKDDLIHEIQQSLNIYPGVSFGFSQPIMDNVEEFVSGVKSSLVIKIFGDDLYELEDIADAVAEHINRVHGIEDVLVFRNIGQPEMQIRLDQERMAFYGVNMADCQSVIEMAIGGKTATHFYDGEMIFDTRIRFQEDYRRDEADIANILIPTTMGGKIPLKEVASIHFFSGPAFIYREGNNRHIAVGFSVRDRDLGSAVAEAQQIVDEHVTIPRGYEMEWAGEFENKERATRRLMQIVPISLLIIFLLLFVTFNNLKDSLIALSTILFAIIGGIVSLLVTGTYFGISAGVGFIILFGVCVLNGVILISVFKQNLREKLPLYNAIHEGVKDRIRPIIMTALMASMGLLPAAISTQIGSEIQKPLAIVIVGGILVAMVLTLLFLPLIFEMAYSGEEKNRKTTPQ